MYIPPSFRIDYPKKLSAFMDAYSFATLVTCHSSEPLATHLPVRQISKDGVCTTLVSHMARANPQWRHFSTDVDVLTIFAGPHAYISPSWYATEPAVPTWNYAAVHVYGRPVIIDDHKRIVSLLNETVSFYEQSFDRPWPGTLPIEFRDQLIESIVAFEIRVTRIEGKFKLGQNRSVDDTKGVYKALAGSQNDDARTLAALMASEGLGDGDSPTPAGR